MNHAFNKVIAPNASVDHVIEAGKQDKGDTLPAEVACNVHPWMKARVLIRDNPYGAVSGKDGSFKIEKLPGGVDLEFVIWHEKVGYIGEAAIAGGTTDKKGRFTVKLTADKDLGEVKVPAAKLK